MDTMETHNIDNIYSIYILSSDVILNRIKGTNILIYLIY